MSKKKGLAINIILILIIWLTIILVFSIFIKRLFIFLPVLLLTNYILYFKKKISASWSLFSMMMAMLIGEIYVIVMVIIVEKISLNEWGLAVYLTSPVSHYILSAIIILCTWSLMGIHSLIKHRKQNCWKGLIDEIASTNINETNSLTSYEYKVYNSHVSLMILELIKMILLLSMFAYALVVIVGKYITISNTNLNKYLFGIIVLISLFWAFYWCNIRIKVTGETLQFIRKNKVYAEYPLYLQFNSMNEKHSIQKKFTGTKRINILKKNHRPINQVCWCIRKEDFSNAMNEIEKAQKAYIEKRFENNVVTWEAAMDKHLEEYSEDAKFFIPKEEIMKAEKKQWLKVILGFSIILCLLIGLWYLFLYDPYMHNNENMFSARILIFISFVLFPGSVCLGNYYLYKRRLPKEITLTPQSIEIDGKRFFSMEIRYITMTPANYSFTNNLTSNRREWVIRTGRELSKYEIGYAVTNQSSDPFYPYVYEEYDKLCIAVQKWCEENNVNFRFQYE